MSKKYIQKFHKGDWVQINKPPPSMHHFPSGVEAIVLESTNDECGEPDDEPRDGYDDPCEYILYEKGEGVISWYEEGQLTLISTCNTKTLDMLKEWKKEVAEKLKPKDAPAKGAKSAKPKKAKPQKAEPQKAESKTKKGTQLETECAPAGFVAVPEEMRGTCRGCAFHPGPVTPDDLCPRDKCKLGFHVGKKYCSKEYRPDGISCIFKKKLDTHYAPPGYVAAPEVVKGNCTGCCIFECDGFPASCEELHCKHPPDRLLGEGKWCHGENRPDGVSCILKKKESGAKPVKTGTARKVVPVVPVEPVAPVAPAEPRVADGLESIPIKLDHRKGMTVAQLIERLNQVKDKNRYVAAPTMGFGGVEGVDRITEVELGGYAGSYSFQATPVVVLH